MVKKKRKPKFQTLNMLSFDDTLPLEIKVEILKRLPIKPLIQFRSVSKSYKSLIDSSGFFNGHHIHKKQTQPPHILINYKLNTDGNPICVSLLDDDDDTFPNNKLSMTIPDSVNQLKEAFVSGSSHGVLCVYGIHRHLGLPIVVLWNPTVRKSVGIVVPGPPTDSTIVSFGVSHNDLKLVKINVIEYNDDTPSCCIHWEVELFTLSSKAWKTLPLNPPPFKFCKLRPPYRVLIPGFVFFLGDAELSSMRIIYFDFNRDEFGEVCLPDSILNNYMLSISKLNDSLVVVDFYEHLKLNYYGVWMMTGVVTQSFTKMFTIKVPAGLILGFRNNGQAIMDTADDDDDDDDHGIDDPSKLKLYDPCSGNMNAIGIKGSFDTFFMTSYTETLLLLNQSDLIIQ